MTQFFRLIFSDLKWFLGTLIVCFALYLFFWNLFAHESFVRSMQALLDDVQAMFHYLLYYAFIALLIFLAIRMMWRGVFPKKSKGH